MKLEEHNNIETAFEGIALLSVARKSFLANIFSFNERDTQ